MNRMRVYAASAVMVVCLAASAEPPSPAAFLKHELGTRFSTHQQIVAYFDRLAELSPLVAVERYGETTEHRELIRAVITSSANRERLAEIRAKLSSIGEPAKTSRERAKEIARNTPMVVLFAFGVHGDETSSPEAAMKLTYWLATAEEAMPILEQVVIVIDPVQNPDGHDQYVQFYSQASGRQPQSDVDSAEHVVPWRSGRANHYFIDMNRDWVWGTQVETQARIRQFREWSPQLFVDFHEMGARDTDYFFPPAADPMNRNVAEDTMQWLETFGRANAKEFSERGWPFYVGETYDLFYPGYGDAWPALRGAIGMTYEVSGGRTAGLVVDRPNGTTMSLTDRIERHFASAVTTLRTAAENREALILHNYEALASSLQNRTTYLIDGRSPSTPSAIEVLERQGIEFSVLAADTSLKVQGVLDDREETRTFPSGTIVVSTAQPMGRLARTLLERSPALDDSFVRQQKERIEAEESDQFYDITAWSIPVSMNLGAWELVGEKLPATASWSKPMADATASARLGWIVSGSDPLVYHFVGLLLSHGIRFSVASSPVTVSETTYPRGSIVVQKSNNDESMPGILPGLTAEAGVKASPIDSFWTRGITLGSARMQFVKDPRIAIVAGGGVNRYSFGAIWFQLDERDRVPHSVIPVERLTSTDLGRFGVLILPDGDYSDLPARSVERLKQWVANGGTVVAIKGASELMRAEDAVLSSLEEWRDEAGDDVSPRSTFVPKVPGAAFRTEMSDRSFLTFGLSTAPPVLIDGSLAFRPLERRVANVVRIASSDPLVAGFAWPESIRRLEGAPYLTIEKNGEGKVITFVDDPNFRLFWRGTYPLLMNAILYGPSFDD